MLGRSSMHRIKFAEEIDMLCDDLIKVVKKRMKNQTETTKVYMDDLIDVLQETRISAHKAERLMNKNEVVH